MSPTSNRIESLAEQYGVPVLDAQEYWVERAAIREYDGGMSRNDAEIAAVEDLRIWCELKVRIGEDGQPHSSPRSAGSP